MKPTQEQILRALNKLVRENKTELKAQKIELALADDLNNIVSDAKRIIGLQEDGFKWGEKAEKQFTKINQAKDEINKEANRIDKEIFNFRDTLNNFNTTNYIKLLSEYRNAAEELGVKIDSQYQEALDNYQKEKREQAKNFSI